MPLEVAGTVSTFGQQALSTKPSGPRTKFGTSGRTHKLAEKQFLALTLGSTSGGCAEHVASAFGQQANSRAQSAPAHRMGRRFKLDHDTSSGMTHPGPGSYSPPADSVGKQPLSANPTSPATRVGTSERFGRIREDAMTPVGGTGRLAHGWMGDAPSFSFHGKAKRTDMAAGMPGLTPSGLSDPGPGAYEAASSMGTQSFSPKCTAPRMRMGTSARERAGKVFLSREHNLHDKLGSHSPSPNCYNPRTNTSSRVKTTSSWRFGSGDRFSEVKPVRPERKYGATGATPGPGAYVV